MNNNRVDYFERARQNKKKSSAGEPCRDNSVFLCRRCELALRHTGHTVKRTDAGQPSSARRCAVCEDYCYGGLFTVTVSDRPRKAGRPNGF